MRAIQRLDLRSARHPGLRATVLGIATVLVVATALLVALDVADHLERAAVDEAVRTTSRSFAATSTRPSPPVA